MPSPGKYPLVVDPVIGNIRLTKILMDGGRSLNIIYAETLGVAELPELFQLKCLSPASEARPHLNGNNPSIPRI